MNRQIDRITDGPLVKAIFSLAVPVVIGMFMEFALASTDYFWLGKLGPAAQDAITSSMVVIWTMMALISLVAVGLSAIVSRHVGARDYTKAAYFIKQGFVAATVLGLTSAVVGNLVTENLLGFMGTSAETMTHAVPYLRIAFIAGIFFFLGDTAYAVFRASGDTKTPTKVGILTVIINLILDPLLIFGYGPFPKLGVTGAAIATLISIIIGAIVILYKMYPSGVGYDISDFWKIKPKVREIGRILKIGLPMSFQQFIFVFVYWFLIKIVHEFGTDAGAAMGIGNRMESFAYLTCYGFSLAASTMVGQNLGAGKPERAARGAWGSVGIAIGLTTVISIFFLFTPRAIASIFTDDPQVMEMTKDYLIILGLSQVTMAVEIVLEGAFGGAGDTIPPMMIMLPGSAIRIPLAYWLCFELDLGLNGVWWTLTITTTIKALILAFWFWRGKWKLKQV